MTEAALRELEANPGLLEVQAELSDRLHEIFTKEVRAAFKSLR